MTVLQLDPSAKAPWIRTMFGRAFISTPRVGGRDELEHGVGERRRRLLGHVVPGAVEDAVLVGAREPVVEGPPRRRDPPDQPGEIARVEPVAEPAPLGREVEQVPPAELGLRGSGRWLISTL